MKRKLAIPIKKQKRKIKELVTPIKRRKQRKTIHPDRKIIKMIRIKFKRSNKN